MAEQISRQELEKKVVNARSKINLSQEDFGWLTSQETSDFLRAWLDLHAYYLTHDGDTTEIDFEIMRSYFDVERFLQEILRNPKYAEHHTQAARLLEALEGFIDDLIKLVTTWESRGFIYDRNFTIEKLMETGAVSIRSGATGFNSILSVIFSGEGLITDTMIYFDTSIAVLL